MTTPVPDLDGFTAAPFHHDGLTRPVYRGGAGPAVLVLHEIPGITPTVAAFARRVVDAGFSVVMPVLFGTPGKPFSAAYAATSGIRACVAREFTALATDRTQPITSWLLALAADAHDDAGGSGVGVVGMCFTGGFALAMMVDDRVLAPVLSQPSLPLPIGRRRARSVGVAPDDLERVRARTAAGACVLGLRFTDDPLTPRARFETLRALLGDAFIAVEIDSSPGNPHGIRRFAHSVLTEDFVDEPGHPTRAALDRVLGFLAQRLR